jgi:exodeoxyribonuclease V gamma subunit
MLQLHFSNRFEILADALLGRLDAGSHGVFEPETVLVPSQAIARSLSLAMADRTGVCANVQFEFLARWLWRQIAQVVPGVGASSPFAVEPLTWRIYGTLRDHAFLASHPRLERYLGSADEVMRLELAGQIAALFDQYVTYREDWLEAWARGESPTLFAADPVEAADAAWQGALWRRVTEGLGLNSRHPGRAFIRALERLPDESRAALVPSVHVFALQSIPPLHLTLLKAIARHTDVHVYVVNPCQEYWFEIIDRRRLHYLEARGRGEGHEVGHRLLAHWGRQTQSYIDRLIETLGEDATDDGAFEVSGRDSLLGRVQDSVLELQDLAPGSLATDAGDRSLEFHVCHSRMRELEALQDYLLGLFAGNVGSEPLRPSDILVVTPDLETTAAAIEAVFSSAPAGRFIPYSITGRAQRRVNAPARTLLELLSLVASRCSAPQLLAVLSQPLVSRRFELDTEGLDAIRRWLHDSGVRWALDAAHREDYGVPASPRHTLESGLDRLFLGFALPDGHAEPLFDELLPAGNAGDAGARNLGSLWRFTRALRTLHDDASASHGADRWVELLLSASDEFLAPEPTEAADLVELRSAIASVGANIALAGVAVPLAAVRTALEKALESNARGGIATGSVTFASMASLRLLPFKVVCILGLDDGVFPRVDRPAEFDLMARHPQRGDRQRRDDDRNVLLDLLLAARERLYLSFVGRSIRDNAPLPPSVLASELLEMLVLATATDPLDEGALRKARARLVVEHPLQPFSRFAFSIDADPRLRSYHAEYAAALTAHAPPLPTAPGATNASDEDDEEAIAPIRRPLFTEALAPPPPESRRVSLSRLVEFLRNPSRFLLTQRLGVRLAQPEDELEDAEPLLPSPQAARALASRLWPHALAGADEATLMRLALAGTEVADGELGRLSGIHEVRALMAHATRSRAALVQATLPPVTLQRVVEVDGEAWHVEASISDLRPAGLVRAQCRPVRPADLLEAWLYQLLLSAAGPSHVEPAVRWLFEDDDVTFTPPDRADAHLTDILALYRDGLRRPVHFFARSALALVARDDIRDARKTWTVSDFAWGEHGDPYHQLALRGVMDPLDGEFTDISHRLFDALLSHRRRDD